VGGSRDIIRVDDEDGAILLSPSPSTTISSAEVDDMMMRNEGVGRLFLNRPDGTDDEMTVVVVVVVAVVVVSCRRVSR
jgi:hypothetical protein